MTRLGKIKTKVLCAALSLLFVITQASAAFAETSNYTYNYDVWGEAVSSPDAYRVSAYLLGTNFGIGAFRDPQGLFVRGNKLYVCDSGNNRIVIITVDGDGSCNLSEIIKQATIDGAESALNYPMDVFEDKNGDLYICDTNNHRVLRLDEDRNFVLAIDKPVDETFSETAEFLPTKLVVDKAGRVFIQARNVNKGLMEFDPQGDFVGYMGANRVKVNPVDLLWKRIASRAQRASMDLFIPTEYNNLCIDDRGFIYATNASGLTQAVRRLNARGDDILVRNGQFEPEGDLLRGNSSSVEASKFIDVTALENDSYVCFDRTRGRLFVYDSQGNLMYAFGGMGNREGCFLIPVALEKMGRSLFALDSRTGAVTRFDLTEYGTMINDALSEYKKGHYEESAGKWEEVLKVNGNYDMAYIGIARSALRQGDYETAMKYFRVKQDWSNWSKAFQQYRKQWMEENLWWILLMLGVLIAAPPVVRGMRKLIKEVREA
jgi:tetratricopeptide (TPR) repeat protein